jgi:hypothetical protein
MIPSSTSLLAVIGDAVIDTFTDGRQLRLLG